MGEAYFLSHIIHDWSEAQWLTILDSCRCGMKPDRRLLIIETVLPTGDAPNPGKMLDIIRPYGDGWTGTDQARVLRTARQSGIRLERIVPTNQQ